MNYIKDKINTVLYKILNKIPTPPSPPSCLSVLLIILIFNVLIHNVLYNTGKFVMHYKQDTCLESLSLLQLIKGEQFITASIPKIQDFNILNCFW